MSNIVGLGWLNTNATRNYPISQEAILKPLGGTGFILPDNLILDMRLSVPYAPNIKPFYFYLKSVSLHASGVIIEIGYHNPAVSGEKVTVAVSEAIPVSSHTNPSSYSLTGVVGELPDTYDFSGVIGTVVVGELKEAAAVAPGYIEFDTTAYLESTVVSMNTVGVSSLRVGDSLLSDSGYTGHVLLRPGGNFIITSTSPAESFNEFTFSALSGVGLASGCTCEGDITLGPCIRSINNLPPSSTGDINIVAGTCMSIGEQTTGGSILLSETCSEPCCGCDQLDILVADFRDLQNGFMRLDSYIAALAGAVESIRSSAFGSVVTSNACGD